MKKIPLTLALLLLSLGLSLGDQSFCYETPRRDRLGRIGQVIRVQGTVYVKTSKKAKQRRLDPVRDRKRKVYAGELWLCEKGGFLKVLVNRVAVTIPPLDEWRSFDARGRIDLTPGIGRRSQVDDTRQLKHNLITVVGDKGKNLDKPKPRRGPAGVVAGGRHLTAPSVPAPTEEASAPAQSHPAKAAEPSEQAPTEKAAEPSEPAPTEKAAAPQEQAPTEKAAAPSEPAPTEKAAATAESEAVAKRIASSELAPAALPAGSLRLPAGISRSDREMGASAAAKRSSKSSEDILPNVRRILERYAAASMTSSADKQGRSSGGARASASIYGLSTEARGTLEMPSQDSKSSIELFTKGFDRTLAIVDLHGSGAIKEGLDGKSVWRQTPGAGTTAISLSQSFFLRFSPLSYSAGRLMSQYRDWTVVDVTRLGDQYAFVLQGTPADGKPERFYFDSYTSLLLRVDSPVTTAWGEFIFQRFLEDYREVDGIRIPFTIHGSTPAGRLTFKLSEFKRNASIADSQFERPKLKHQK